MAVAGAQESKPPAAFDLPDGAAKQTVATTCTGCHDLSRIINANHSAAEWRSVVNMMVTAGAKLSATEKDAVAQYLIEKFPGRPMPRPLIIAGPVQVSFHEWQVPTAGSRPHDPLATPDGYIWYTGQMANTLGRVDPATGAIKEFPLPTPMSGPHGLVDDKDGSGSRRTSPAISANSMRRPARSRNTRFRIRRRAIRTLCCSTMTAFSGSRCRTPTWSAGSIPGAAISSSCA